MPTTYNDTVFCVPQDVINYINSSEIVLQRGRADNSSIGIASVDTTANKITTGANHYFIANDSVQFATSTGGTLPAPLNAGTDYFVITAGLAPTTFEVSTVRGGAAIDLTTAGSGTLTVRNTTIEKIIALKLGIAKNDIFKYDLIKEANRRFSTTIADFTNEMYSAVDDARAKQDRSIGQSGVNEIFPGSWGDFFSSLSYNPLGFFSQIVDTDSNIFCNFGVPDSSVKHAAGSIVINTDTSVNQFPYVNRGTNDAPVWVRFQPKDLINFISNPEVLKMSVVYCTLMLMARDGMFANRANYQDAANSGFTLDAERLFALLYDEEKNGKLSPDQKKRISDGNFGLIEWDIAGNGIITDYALSKTNDTPSAFIW